MGHAGISVTQRSQTRLLSLVFFSVSLSVFTSLSPSLPRSLSDFSLPAQLASERKEETERGKDKQRQRDGAAVIKRHLEEKGKR